MTVEELEQEVAVLREEMNVLRAMVTEHLKNKGEFDIFREKLNDF